MFEMWKGRESKRLWYLWEVWRVLGTEKSTDVPST
jgi:hypothetical protein